MSNRKARFLRDNILEEMLKDIHAISDNVINNTIPTLIFNNSLGALAEMYETNRVVLIHLENTIEKMRKQNIDSDMINPVVEAAAHIQISLMSIHNSLKEDVQQTMKSMVELKTALHIQDEE